ncbi:MAG: hypothetical protein RIE73_12745 [Coleofasciculus sp. C1-SOL-03]|jgi:hypothetical protein|uniref:hypothetical protein n=1 Tax=Coleofasciculus sp. C1-SOL-03 TaxID=3069522 RepID=UPI0033052F0F
MRIKSSEYRFPQNSTLNQRSPQPGEIWEVNRSVYSPLELSWQEQQNLFPDSARRFLAGNSPPRYVMIVKEPESPVAAEAEWQVVSVMVLSLNTDFLSSVDLLIPANLSGVGQDLLAQTWHVLPMLTCNLSHPIGKRLSREVYDLLLDVGDYYQGLIDQPPSAQAIELGGLKIGKGVTEQQPKLQAFHQQEEAWSAVLNVPVAAYNVYLKTMNLTAAIVEDAVQLEQELIESGATLWGKSQPNSHRKNWRMSGGDRALKK